VIRAVQEVIRAPKDPPRQIFWPTALWRRDRRPGRFGALAIGLTGGSIAMYIAVYKAPPMLGALLGLTQALPLLLHPVADRRLPPRHDGHALGQRAIRPARALHPWPEPALIAHTLILFVLGASYRRPAVIGAGIISSVMVAVSATALARFRAGSG